MDSGAYPSDWQVASDGRPIGADKALRYLYDRVGRCTSQARVQQQIRRIWPRRCPPNSDTDGSDIFALAINLLGHAPDPKGRTAFDRLAVRETMPDRETLETLNAIRSATFKVVQVERVQSNGWADVRDVLTHAGGTLAVLDVQPDDVLAGFMAQAQAGYFWPTTVYVCPPRGMADVPRELVDRSGTRFKNPLRAAERAYANAVARTLEAGEPIVSMLRAPGQIPISDAAGGTDPIDDERLEANATAPTFVRQLLDVAERWADLQPADPRDADPATVRWLRQEARAETALAAVGLASLATPGSPQAQAHDALARLLVETVEHRATVGLGGTTLDALNALPGTSRPSDDAVAYLHRLRAELTPGADAQQNGKQARVIAQIRALRAKTEAAGCTEAEALAAAEKAEELLRRYDVSLTPAQVSEHTCTAVTLSTGRKRADGIDACVPAIASLCDCRSWVQTCPQGHRAHVFFGLPPDVAAAEAVYRIVQATFAAETAAFKESDTYRASHASDRGQATKSFRWGLGYGIREKLDQLASDRARQTATTSGQALIRAKEHTLADGLDKLGLTFERERSGKRYVDPEAYDQGVQSGRAFAPDDQLPVR